MNKRIALRAPAKINLTLEVIGRLPDGYHAIRSIFARVDKLADTIDLDIVEAEGEPCITLSTSSPLVPVDETNLCHRAASAYFAAAGTSANVHIGIRKNIPVGAGLGGGSSDAAAVLAGLNSYFRAPLLPHELEAVGAGIGKDVTFFIRGAKMCHVSGNGEIMKTIPSSPPLHLLIVYPGIVVSTADAYRALDDSLWFMSSSGRADASKTMADAVRSSDSARIAAALHNDFEPVIERAHPVIKEIKQALRAFGARGALMTGSGSAVFGLFDSTQALRSAQLNITDHYRDCAVVSA